MPTGSSVASAAETVDWQDAGTARFVTKEYSASPGGSGMALQGLPIAGGAVAAAG